MVGVHLIGLICCLLAEQQRIACILPACCSTDIKHTNAAFSILYLTVGIHVYIFHGTRSSLFLTNQRWTHWSALDPAAEPKCSSKSLMSSWSNFGWSSTPEKVLQCSVFSPCVGNGSHCGSLESQCI
ncbi:hypothetical protein CHARACLAT_033698 [Characodon lateralis]|uniref:Secreted protein n=1 Tax=Characodon lateralis TaxID=208331 RepID=A0ABU7DC81_9TELE|nr:hypothetical protein [Characodon lateralis]